MTVWVLQVQPNMVGALNNLAFILTDRMNKPEEALPYADKARQIDPRNAAVLDTDGWVCFRLGRFDQAEAALKEALSVDANYLAARYHLGMLYKDRGRNAEARATLRRVVEDAEKVDNKEYGDKAQEALSGLP